MRRRIVGLLICGVLMSCGGDTTGPGRSAAVASVTITPNPTPDMRAGDTLRLTATVRDVTGAIRADIPVTWRSETDSIVHVSSTGLLTVATGTGFGGGIIGIDATADTVTGSAAVSIRDWGFERSTDPVTGTQFAEANLGAKIGAYGPPRLYLRCHQGQLDIYVAVFGVTASGAVDYRFDTGTAHTETWTEAQDFSALFYPGDPHAFASTIAQSDTLLMRYSLYSGPTVTATFDLRQGLAPYLSSLFEACP